MPPGSHECVLDSVLRALGVTQDELGHAEQAGKRRRRQLCEGFVVPCCRPFDER